MSVFPTYNRFPIHLVSGKGTVVIDEQGKEYLDFVSGIAVCNLGHSPDYVKEALKDQLEKVWHVSNLYEIPEQESAANWLTKFTELSQVFFCNSGAEANEAAIKLARKHTGKEKIVSFEKSFHGRTFAAMSATGQPKVHEGYGNLLPTFEYLPFNDTAAVKEITSDTAAVMVEVIQGEGGVIEANGEFLEAVQEKCKEIGALFVIDEVQTGIGRTGYPFAYQHFDLDPDIVTSAKGMGSGFPTGAMIGKQELAESFGAGAHGSTFGGSPLASAAVKATLETIFQEAFLEEVKAKGKFLKEKLTNNLNQVDLVEQVRGRGLMTGIAIKEAALPIIKKLQTAGMLTVLAGPNVIRLLPPLTVTYPQLEKAAELITQSLVEYQAQLYSKTDAQK